MNQKRDRPALGKNAKPVEELKTQLHRNISRPRRNAENAFPRAAKFSTANHEAAALILADPDRYGNGLAVRWARAFLLRSDEHGGPGKRFGGGE
jgi:hypothetical protein